MKKPGRNETCPCGSGEKYKHCCLKKDSTNVAAEPENSDSVADLLNLAKLHLQAGRLTEADNTYQQILKIDPENCEALHLLGLIARQVGQIEIAIELISKALTIQPDTTMFYNLGVALQEHGDQHDAIECYKNALIMKPDYAKVYVNLGALLQTQGNLTEAINNYKQGLKYDPTNVNLHVSLGVAYQARGNATAAVDILEKALKISPNDPVANNNLGNVYANQGEFTLAKEKFHKALSIAPEYAEAYNNLAICLAGQGQHEKAVDSFDRALSINPDNPKTLWNQSMSLLSLGRLPEGWEKYEYRLMQPAQTSQARAFSQARYSGEDLQNKTILIWAEQGIGDEMLFASVLPDIIRVAGGCIIECEPRLVSLYSRSFPHSEVVPKTFPPHIRTQQSDIDYQCPVGSLAKWFRPSINSFPNHQGYLEADKSRVAFWKKRLNKLGDGLRVGISWRSMHRTSSRNEYYTELRQWQSILQLPGISFINLQYDECRDELEQVKDLYGVKIHTWEDIDLLDDIDEAAALTSALDIVIAPCSTVFVTGAALGKDTWMLNLENDLWMLGTHGFPIYPHCRLFVKPLTEEWDNTLKEVASELILASQSVTRKFG